MTVKLTLDYGFGKRQTSEENTRTRTHARLTGRATLGELKAWSDSSPQNVIIAIFFQGAAMHRHKLSFFLFFLLGRLQRLVIQHRILQRLC